VGKRVNHPSFTASKTAKANEGTTAYMIDWLAYDFFCVLQPIFVQLSCGKGSLVFKGGSKAMFKRPRIPFKG